MLKSHNYYYIILWLVSFGLTQETRFATWYISIGRLGLSGGVVLSSCIKVAFFDYVNGAKLNLAVESPSFQTWVKSEWFIIGQISSTCAICGSINHRRYGMYALVQMLFCWHVYCEYNHFTLRIINLHHIAECVLLAHERRVTSVWLNIFNWIYVQ